MSSGRLVVNSLLLFIDQMIVSAIGGWFYWLMLSKLTSAADIGQATAVYSLINLAAALSTLGIEYPLLKRSHVQRSQILGTALFIQFGATLVSMPFVLYILNTVYSETLEVIVVAMIILFSWAVLLATRFAILGTSGSRTILLIDVFGTMVRFASAYVLLYYNFESLGILISIMLFNLSSAGISLYFCTKIYGFKLSHVKNTFELVKEGLANMLSILSRTLVYTLSIVLLVAVGTEDADVGTFYIVLMISLFAGGLITSTAYMILPFSSASGSDLSLMSTRLALSFTVPIIAILITAPNFLLSLIR